jgi:hypothetical protein
MASPSSYDPGPPKWLSRVDPPPGPAPGPELVNENPLTNQDFYKNINKLKVDNKTAAQTSKSYGGAA